MEGKGSPYLFWSSWRRQTNKEGWNLQERRVLPDGSYLPLHLRHNFSAALAGAAAAAAPESIAVDLREIEISFWLGGPAGCP